ncbi:MAG: LysR family transcriptional regulator [Pirellulaceae bacterium]
MDHALPLVNPVEGARPSLAAQPTSSFPSHPMELSQLRYFAKAAELGNFTRAAEACYVSQPSLSQQILKLEEEIGQPLFDRVGRSVRLTDAGRLLKERVDEAIRLLDEAKIQLRDEPDAGRLLIAAIPTIAPYLLPRVVKDFCEKYPRAQIEIIEDVTAGIVRRCQQGELDLALVALPVAGASLYFAPLFTEELLVALPPDHRLANKSRLTLRDLTDEHFVLLADAHCLTGNALSFCHAKGFQPIATSRVNQLATVLELIALGHGVSLVPAMARAMDGSSARLYRSLAGEKPTRTVGMLWNEHRFQSKLFRSFVAHLEEKLPQSVSMPQFA